MKRGTYKWYAERLGVSLRTAKRTGKAGLQKKLEDRINEIDANFCAEMDGMQAQDLKDFDEYLVNSESRKLGILLMNKVLKRLNAIVDHDAKFKDLKYPYFLLRIAEFIRGRE